ncbi:hypothetical protein [Streptomyces sp. t39]|uniref:hypothetical protein n=1 Tax=Streptomyces sp. t39 TaxID=1828156 RepID=UPI0011CE2585|nr:hypothetical protein [Streptomyces sp. t39]TXS35055.1 hypothetical protein EAO77_37810 [Streptomyces sp. t39]
MSNIDMSTVTIPQLHEAQRWVLDHVWADMDDDAVAELTGAQIVKGIQQHYEGGWEAFVRDRCPEQRPTMMEVLKQHQGCTARVGGAWSTAMRTVDATDDAEGLGWLYGGFVVECHTHGVSLSQQWNG